MKRVRSLGHALNNSSQSLSEHLIHSTPLGLRKIRPVHYARPRDHRGLLWPSLRLFHHHVTKDLLDLGRAQILLRVIS